IFYSDVDDTLIQGAKVSQEVEEFLKYMSTKEDFFVPCSGRPLISMTKAFTNQGLKYVIAYNGGQIYDLVNKKLVYNNLIKKEQVQTIIKELEKLKIDYITYEDQIIYTNNPNNKYAQVEAELSMEPLTLIKEIHDTPKILGLIDPSKSETAIKALKEKFTNVEIFKSKDFFIEITPLGITKGKAIQKLNEILSIQNNDTYCFGDSHNDLSMFELKIHKIAVANAKAKIIELADELTATCAENGVIKYIKNYYGELNE
ncbi:MAG: Cof-type HAD-IIB family hydrolase, partial [Mycoplasmatales bacterium]